MSQSSSKVRFFIFVFIVFVVISVVVAKSGSSSRHKIRYAGDDLNLKALAKVLEKSKNAEELEKNINDPAQKINNIDLDENGKVDFVHVEEFLRDGVRGFSLYVEHSSQDRQEVATITFKESGDTYIHGNRHIYGNGHYYHHRYRSGGFYMWPYLFGSRHDPYRSRYGYNRYPSGYAQRSHESTTSYASRMDGVAKSSPMAKGTGAAPAGVMAAVAASPNATRTSNRVKAPIKSPTAAQKSFQSRNPSKQTRSGGFGRGTSRSRSRSGTRSFGGK